MRNLILFGLLIVLLLAAQFTSAKTVEDIIEKYIRARGGKNRLAAIQSIYMEGIKEVAGKDVSVKITKLQAKMSRTEIETQEAKGFVLITDSEGLTYFSLRTPPAVTISAEDINDFKVEMDIAGPLFEYAEKGHTVELIGKEAVEGNMCYKIKLTLDTGKQMMFWLDTSTYLLTQSVSLSHQATGRKRETYTSYRNYKQVAGVQFAHSLCTNTYDLMNDNPEVEIVFHSIVINSPISPLLFQPV
ncbi:MAG: hypothetical protein ABIN94_12630 [Ferruginibacter sp.]